MDVQKIADRYVARDGSRPLASRAADGHRLCRATLDDIQTLGSFLAWQDDDRMQGGVRSAQAWRAFCRILNLPAGEFRDVMRG